MSKEGLHADPCAAVFTALVATVRSSGLTLENSPNDWEFTDEERLVLAYLHHRVKERAIGTSDGVKTPSSAPGDDPAQEPKQSEATDLDNKPAAWKVGEAETPLQDDMATGTEEEAKPVAAPAQEHDGIGTNAADEPVQDEGPAEEEGHTGAPADTLEDETVPQGEVFRSQSSKFKERDSETGAQNLADEASWGNTSGEAPGSAEAATEQETDIPKAPSGIPQVGRMPAAQPERVSLPNAKANTPYEARIDGYTNLRLRDDAGSELLLEEDGVVRSDAMPAGEYKIDMGGIKNGRSVSIVVRLSVIPCPQNLWTSIPSDQGAPQAKSDEDFEAIEGEAFLVAASKRGRSHAKEGSFRDDDFGLNYDPASGWHVMVVADGAGSAKLSREGSRVACDVTVDALKTLLPDAVDPKAQTMVEALRSVKTEKDKRAVDILRPVYNSLREAAYSAALKIRERAEQLEYREADLSTTLAIAAAKRIDGQWLVLSFSIGDGGVGVWDGNAGNVALMCRPDSGEFAGQTCFLSVEELTSGKDWASRVFAELCDDFTAVMVMTDGITDPKFETDAALADPERWRTLWKSDLTKEVTFSRKNAKLEEEFLGWLDFWSRGNHDDRTLAVMVLRDAEPAAEEEGIGV